jgi:hypothetical protein
MRQLTILILLLPFLSFSQNLVGTWVKANEKEIGIRFSENGNLELVDLKQPENKVLRNITITYQKVKDNKDTFLIIQMFKNEKVFETKKIKYFYKKRKLYLPNFLERNNVETVRHYEDEYAKLSKRELKKIFRKS